MSIDGVIGAYERLYWRLDLEDPDIDYTSSEIDIGEGKTGTLMLVYSKVTGSPYYFDSQDHQTGNESKYKLEPDKWYAGTLLMEYDKDSEKEWPIKVHSSRNEIGLYHADEHVDE
jgi:hypothetical protein